LLVRKQLAGSAGSAGDAAEDQRRGLGGVGEPEAGGEAGDQLGVVAAQVEAGQLVAAADGVAEPGAEAERDPEVDGAARGRDARRTPRARS
jgi:hypothetical protein